MSGMTFSRLTSVAVMVATLWTLDASHARSASVGYWSADRLVNVILFTSVNQDFPGPPRVRQEAFSLSFNYKVYQNPGGLVRRQLVKRTGFLSGIRGTEGDRGNQLLDYEKGWLLTFFDDDSRAVRSAVDPAGARVTAIRSQRILGLECQGSELRYKDGAGAGYVRQRWVAAESDFRDPILEVGYKYHPDGSLWEISVSAITSLEPVESLDAGLFEVPVRIKITEAQARNAR